MLREMMLAGKAAAKGYKKAKKKAAKKKAAPKKKAPTYKSKKTGAAQRALGTGGAGKAAKAKTTRKARMQGVMKKVKSTRGK